MISLVDTIKPYKTISIIGMAKNVGKTTTLNALLDQLADDQLAITSIGRDGESTDLVTNTKKPAIYVKSGTLIATARHCLQQSDFTKQILEMTGVMTPLGEVVIVRALSDGYVDLAGPSSHEAMKKIVRLLLNYGVDHVLIDGAVSRKGIADYFVSDATILATGAAYSSDLEQVVADTKHLVDLLQLPILDDELKNQFKAFHGAVSVMDFNGDVHILPVKTTLDVSEIIDFIDDTSRYVIMKGALTEKVVEKFISLRHKFNQLTIVVENGTKCFFNKITYDRLKKSQIQLVVIEPTQILGVSYNPTSPYGYDFNPSLFEQKLKQAISLPIFNVMRDQDAHIF